MRICYLADAQSPHTQKWVVYFVSRGCEVHLISFRKAEIKGVNAHYITPLLFIPGKIDYLFYLSKIKNLIQNINPDILHAHYATGYGLIGAYSGFHPYVISIWGSDVFNFPNKSLFHRKLIVFNLKKADYLCATSLAIVREVTKYTDKKILVTPFGVNCEKFKPLDSKASENEVVVGAVKALEEKYGIEYLIKAFFLVVKKYPERKLKLLIIGRGSLRKKLENLAENLRVGNLTEFTGGVPNDLVPTYLNRLSVFVNISKNESFGVAVLEASACGIPVIVSNVGGLPEVVKDCVTGFIVPPRNPEATAIAIEKLIFDENLRKKIGRAGRGYVLKNYELTQNAKIMENLYKEIIEKRNLYREVRF